MDNKSEEIEEESNENDKEIEKYNIIMNDIQYAIKAIDEKNEKIPFEVYRDELHHPKPYIGSDTYENDQFTVSEKYWKELLIVARIIKDNTFLIRTNKLREIIKKVVCNLNMYTFHMDLLTFLIEVYPH